jgi:hypothetical protein
MRDRALILTALVLFLALITFPAWYNLAAGKTSKGPDLRLPAQEKRCVAPVSYMRTSHMALLVDWRDEVVRNNVRTFRAFDGRTHTISLTGTCLKCHDRKADFCDRCHNYAGLQGPYCWDCHIDPALVKPLGPARPPQTDSRHSRGAGPRPALASFHAFSGSGPRSAP